MTVGGMEYSKRRVFELQITYFCKLHLTSLEKARRTRRRSRRRRYCDVNSNRMIEHSSRFL